MVVKSTHEMAAKANIKYFWTKPIWNSLWELNNVSNFEISKNDAKRLFNSEQESVIMTNTYSLEAFE